MHAEERFNSISHLFGAALALIGTLILITFAWRLGDPWRIASFTVYGQTEVNSVSTLFSLSISLRWSRSLRVRLGSWL